MTTAPGPPLTLSYRDVRAEDLGLHLGLARQPAIAERTLALGSWTIELRILAASHQVLAHRHGEVVCSETVACIGGGAPDAGPLPHRRRARLPAVTHEIISTVQTIPAIELEQRVEALMAELGRDPDALAVAFPGADHAATGLRARTEPDGSLLWSSWHSYPQTAEIVLTESRLDPFDLRIGDAGGHDTMRSS